MNVFPKSLRISTIAICVALMSTMAFAGPKGPKGPKGPTILEVAEAVNSSPEFAGTFDILIEAVNFANPAVAATLDGRGQYTVFAPTDMAFMNFFSASEAEILTLIQNGTVTPEALTPILLYHVAKGRRDAGDVTTSTQIRMLDGQRIQVMGTNLTDIAGGVSTIVVTDVPARNGIIHAIDGVLNPSPAE